MTPTPTTATARTLFITTIRVFMVTPGWWTWRKVWAEGRGISHRPPRRPARCGRYSEADQRRPLAWSGRERRCRAGSSDRPETPLPRAPAPGQGHRWGASSYTPPAPCRTSLGQHRAEVTAVAGHWRGGCRPPWAGPPPPPPPPN